MTTGNVRRSSGPQVSLPTSSASTASSSSGSTSAGSTGFSGSSVFTEVAGSVLKSLVGGDSGSSGQTGSKKDGDAFMKKWMADQFMNELKQQAEKASQEAAKALYGGG